jgi:hypothetical protein
MATADVFIKPLNLSDFNPSPSSDSPGFAQLVQDVLGDDATSVDGFDSLLSDAASIVAALDQVLAAQDAALDELLALHASADPGNLDQSVAGYMGTFDTGAGLVAAGQGLAPPNLLELPITPSYSGNPFTPPILDNVDFGNVKIGSAPISVHLGFTVYLTSGGTLGLWSVSLQNADQPEWQINTTEHDTINGDQHLTYDLVFTPTVLGKTTAQVNTMALGNSAFTIHTYTANVVP